MPSHEERALELVEFQDSLRALSEPVVTELQEAIAQALAEVEREAYERAAKVAEDEIADLRKDRASVVELANKHVAEIERTRRNRDMWKGQCARQAEQLGEMRELLAALLTLGVKNGGNVIVSRTEWVRVEELFRASLPVEAPSAGLNNDGT